MSPVVAASVLTLLHPALVSLSSLDRSSLCLLQAHKSLDVGPPPVSPHSELQEILVAIQEQSGVLCFHSR